MWSMIRHVCKGLHGEDMRAELQRDKEHREYTLEKIVPSASYKWNNSIIFVTYIPCI